MAKATVIVTVRLPEQVKAYAESLFSVRYDTTDVLRLGPANAQGAHGILTSSIERYDAGQIAALPDSMQVISTFSAGFEHIDLAAAQARGIAVCNTPDVLSISTAEIGMQLILMAARRAGEGERLLRAGQWKGWQPDLLIGVQLHGRRLGIFGMGSIGRHLARMARGFGMEIHYRNRTSLSPAQENGAIWHNNDDSFLAACDVLSLNAPGGAGTRHWLNAARIAQLPAGVIVVNTSRGSVIDDTALIAALKSRHVRYAGLDVFEDEPNFNRGYQELDNAVLLPHMGSSTAEARDAMGRLAVDGIAAVLAGKRPGNLVR